MSFVDIKVHKFYYWLGTPALLLAPPPVAEEKAPAVEEYPGVAVTVESPLVPLAEELGSPELHHAFCQEYCRFVQRWDTPQPFFVATLRQGAPGTR